MSNQSNLARAIHFITEEIIDDRSKDNFDTKLHHILADLINIKAKRYENIHSK